MSKEALLEMLKDASSSRTKDGVHRFDPQRSATLMFAAGESMESVDRVVRVSARSEYVVAETDRGERVYIDATRVVGIRLEKGAEGSGFVQPE